MVNSSPCDNRPISEVHLASGENHRAFLAPHYCFSEPSAETRYRHGTSALPTCTLTPYATISLIGQMMVRHHHHCARPHIVLPDKLRMALRAFSRRSHSTTICASLLVYDFLTPVIVQPSRRAVSSTSRCRSAADPHPAGPDSVSLPQQPTGRPRSDAVTASSPVPRSKPLTQAQRDFLSSAVSMPGTSRSVSNVLTGP